MRTIAAQLHRLFDFLARGIQISRLLAWSLVALSTSAFLLPYFLFSQLFTSFQTYGSFALVPLCLAAYYRERRAVLVTWGVITLAIACSLWLHVGLLWSGDVINNFIVGNTIGLIVGLSMAQFFRMHRQIVAARLAAQEQEQAYEIQQQLGNLKDQLILNLSHELRTPLTGVYGYLELLGKYRQQLDEVQQANFIARAANGCAELHELISNILDVNQLNQEELKTPLEPIALAQFVQEMIDQWDPRTVGDHEICLNVPEDIVVQTHPQYLRQILRNLLSNALKYSPPHSRVLISATPDNSDPQGTIFSSQVYICVKDEGPGIPPAEIALLFNKFIRLKRDLAGTVRGSGLGLYISKRLVEAMHGRIWVESSGKAGEGSRFCFLLPSASPHP